METCKVEFTCESGQKIVLDFSLDNNGDLDYKPSFEPKLTDPKTNLGLAGQLCEIFISALVNGSGIEDTQIKDNGPKRKLES